MARPPTRWLMTSNTLKVTLHHRSGKAGMCDASSRADEEKNHVEWAMVIAPTTERFRDGQKLLFISRAPGEIKTIIAAPKSNNGPLWRETDALLRLYLHRHGGPLYHINRFVLASLALKVRCSQPGPSGAIRVSNIDAPHLGHVGCTMSCNCEWMPWRMVTPDAIADESANGSRITDV